MKLESKLFVWIFYTFLIFNNINIYNYNYLKIWIFYIVLKNYVFNSSINIDKLLINKFLYLYKK